MAYDVSNHCRVSSTTGCHGAHTQTLPPYSTSTAILTLSQSRAACRYGVMLMIVVMCMIREPIRVHGRRNKQSGAVTGGPRKPSLMEVGMLMEAHAHAPTRLPCSRPQPHSYSLATLG